MKKEDGAYAKYATVQLLAMGYQSRLGVIAAGCHGAAQVSSIGYELSYLPRIVCVASVSLLLMGCSFRSSSPTSIPAASVQGISEKTHRCQRQGDLLVQSRTQLTDGDVSFSPVRLTF